MAARPRARRLPPLLWAGCLAACSGGGEVDPPVASGIELDALCTEIAAADCDRLQACGTLFAPFDRALCLERQRDVVVAHFALRVVVALAAGALAAVSAGPQAEAEAVREAVRRSELGAAFRAAAGARQGGLVQAASSQVLPSEAGAPAAEPPSRRQEGA